MGGELLSSAIAGGLGGIYGDLAEQRRIRSQQELAQIRGEIQQMITQMNAGSRERVAAGHDETSRANTETTADSRRDVANTNATSREKVADKNNAASLERVNAQVKGAFDRMTTQEAGRNQRWNTPSANATLSSDTARRGQDIGAATARRGQDLNFTLGGERNALTERGQDIDFGLGQERNARGRSLFDIAFQPDANADPNGPAPVAAPPPAPKATLPPPVVKPGGGGDGGDAGMARHTVTRQYAPLPVTPRTKAPAAPAAGGDPLGALTTQAQAMLDAYNRERDPGKKRALQQKLIDLKKQRDALVAAGGGG